MRRAFATYFLFLFLLFGSIPVLAQAGQYDCPSGQTYSSQGNGGAGGCVAQPTTGAAVTPLAPSDASNPKTYNPPPGSEVVSNGNLKYVPLEPIPGLENLTGNLEFNQLLAGIFRILILFGGIIAVGAFVYAGVVYMVSEAIGTKVYAKQRIKAAFLGLLLLVGCWLILQTINPQLLIFNNGLNPVPINYQIVGSGPSSDPVITTNNGTIVPTFQVAGQDEAIRNAQNNPTDEQAVQAATAIRQRLEASCVNTYSGVIGPGEVSTGCTQDTNQHFVGNKIYSGCANITTPRGVESCYYNK